MIRGLQWLALAAFILGGVWAHGHKEGEEAATARHEKARRVLQERLFVAGEELSRQAEAIAALEADQDMRVREFEDEARGNLDDARPGIGADGLRQLDALWGAP
jgi:hypothetical protein